MFPYFYLQPSKHLKDAEQRQLQVSPSRLYKSLHSNCYQIIRRDLTSLLEEKMLREEGVSTHAADSAGEGVVLNQQLAI